MLSDQMTPFSPPAYCPTPGEHPEEGMASFHRRLIVLPEAGSWGGPSLGIVVRAAAGSSLKAGCRPTTRGLSEAGRRGGPSLRIVVRAAAGRSLKVSNAHVSLPEGQQVEFRVLADVHREKHQTCPLNDSSKCLSVHLALRFKGRFSRVQANRNGICFQMGVQISVASIYQGSTFMLPHLTSIFVGSKVYKSPKPFVLQRIHGPHFWIEMTHVIAPIKQFVFGIGIWN
jgi:hypothetical protein